MSIDSMDDSLLSCMRYIDWQKRIITGSRNLLYRYESLNSEWKKDDLFVCCGTQIIAVDAGIQGNVHEWINIVSITVYLLFFELY